MTTSSDDENRLLRPKGRGRNSRGAAAPATRLRPLREQVREAATHAESRIILQALQQHHWNRRRTAEALKISYRTLMYKMKRCNLRDTAVIDRMEAL